MIISQFIHNQKSYLASLSELTLLVIAFSSFLFNYTFNLLPLTSNPFISSIAYCAAFGLSKLTKPIPFDFPFF